MNPDHCYATFLATDYGLGKQNPVAYILPADKRDVIGIVYTKEYDAKTKGMLDTADYKATTRLYTRRKDSSNSRL